MLRTDKILKWVKGPKVLDVGCTGHNVEIGSPYWLHGRLRQQFSNVVGIDVFSQNVLAEDYRPDDPSRRYRTFVRLITWLRPVIPKRLRNNTNAVRSDAR